jgi:hypothetical protein
VSLEGEYPRIVSGETAGWDRRGSVFDAILLRVVRAHISGVVIDLIEVISGVGKESLCGLVRFLGERVTRGDGFESPSFCDLPSEVSEYT